MSRGPVGYCIVEAVSLTRLGDRKHDQEKYVASERLLQDASRIHDESFQNRERLPVRPGRPPRIFAEGGFRLATVRMRGCRSA
jgi:hypothetical protein